MGTYELASKGIPGTGSRMIEYVPDDAGYWSRMVRGGFGLLRSKGVQSNITSWKTGGYDAVSDKPQNGYRLYFVSIIILDNESFTNNTDSHRPQAATYRRTSQTSWLMWDY